MLETLTPTEYAQFRYVLGPASGFQSHQNRLIEIALGKRDRRVLETFGRATVRVEFEAALQPSLYDEFLRWLARRGFAVPQEVLERDVTQPYVANDAVTEVIVAIYPGSGRQLGRVRDAPRSSSTSTRRTRCGATAT